MKAKKVLSLLLAVAMSATSAISAFAATAPVEGYVKLFTTDLSTMDTSKIYGALPVEDGENAIRVDLTVTPMSDADIQATFQCSPQDLGCPADWENACYLVTVDWKNLGTLVASRTGAIAALYKYSGFKVVAANLKFTFGDDVVYGFELDSTLAGASKNGDGWYSYGYSASTGAANAYPSTLGTYENASVDGAVTTMFFAKPGAEIALSEGYVMYNNFNNAAAADTAGKHTDDSACQIARVAAWGPESITLGEGGLDDKIEAKTDSTTGATKLEYGSDVDAADKKLEGKYIVMRDAVAAAGSINKNSRVVVTYTDTDDLGLDKVVEYGKTIFAHLGLDDSEGTVTTKAIKFGVVYTDARYKAANFTFTIK